ncbi:Uncharacterised protein [uncultured archaeon]|nr:Uncharacterised protein [uncultured archaeon]
MASDFDFNHVRRWLGLTDQQFMVLKSIYRLQKEGGKVSAQRIERDLEKSHQIVMQKSRLFALLRALRDQKIIDHAGRGDFTVNFKGMQAVLKEGEQQRKDELDAVSMVASDVEDYFYRNINAPDHPIVDYLPYDNLYKALANAAQKSAVFLVADNFPQIAYTPALSEGLKRTAYTHTLWRRCIKEKSLRVLYLTDVDGDYLFNQCLHILGDPLRAYREATLVIENLQNMIDSDAPLDVRMVAERRGLDVAIPEPPDGNPVEFYMLTRDENDDVMGGIHLRSRNGALHSKKTFKQTFDPADRMKGAKARQVLKTCHKALEMKYGVLLRGD